MTENSKNDTITLGELTEYENAEWQFPDTVRCPYRSCSRIFDTRSNTIEHYRKTHAKHSVLCKICNYPLMLMKGAHHFKSHYMRKHPSMPPPVKVKVIRVSSHDSRFVCMHFVLLNFIFPLA